MISGGRITTLAGLLLFAAIPGSANGVVLITESSVESLEMSGTVDQQWAGAALSVHLLETTTGFREIALEAEHLRIELDSQVDDPVAMGRIVPNGNTNILYEGPAAVSTASLRDNYDLVLNATAARTSYSGSQMSYAAAEADHREHPMNSGQNREVDPVALNGSLAVELTDGNLTVEGSFWFSVWEWDLIVNTPDQTFVVQTGQTYEGPRLPDGTPIGGRMESRAAFVFVEAGRLTLPILDDMEFVNAWVSSGTVEGTLTLSGQPLSGSRLENHTINGNFETVFDRQSGAPKVTIRETINETSPLPEPSTSEEADAQTIVRSDSPGADGLGMWFWAVLAIALVGSAPLARSLWLRRLLTRVRRWHAVGQHEAVVDGSPPLLRSRRFASAAAELHALSLIEVEGPEAATIFLDWLTPRQNPGDTSMAFLRACIAHRLARPSEAREHLSAMAQDPGLRQRVEAHPALRQLLGFSHHGTDTAYA